MMSVLSKSRKRAEEKRKEEEAKKRDAGSAIEPKESPTPRAVQPAAVPNRERKSPIVSFSISIELRECLQALRQEKAINLSMWVEKRLREALTSEFPRISLEYLQS